MNVLSNISNPTMRSGLDFKSASGPVRNGGFEMTSHTNKSLLKVR